MPRNVKEVNLATREARKRLSVTSKPYFRSLDEGVHLGYRQSVAGSSWVVRWYKGDGKYGTENLAGRPDDVLDADGDTVLNWSQAQRRAREFFQRKQRELNGLDEVQAGPYTVSDALEDYIAAYRRRGGKAERSMQNNADALIKPILGDIALNKLSRRRVEEWHQKLSEAGARLRTKAGEKQRFRATDATPEATRRRRSTANRVLTILKAALNHAVSERRVGSDEAWRPVKPFREVDAARVRYLNDAEAKALVNAADEEFRPLIQAALLTGCRYGELAALTATDYNADAGTIHIRVSKAGKPRHVVLTDEGRRFFTAATRGKPVGALVFTGNDGTAWGKSHQHRPFKDACKRAEIAELTFHELRHTYASRLAMNAVPLAVIAAQLGHSDTRMVEKHYGHMSPSYIAETVRAAFGNIGIVPETDMPIIN